jgi:hypothetical protein
VEGDVLVARVEGCLVADEDQRREGFCVGDLHHFMEVVFNVI